MQPPASASAVGSAGTKYQSSVTLDIDLSEPVPITISDLPAVLVTPPPAPGTPIGFGSSNDLMELSLELEPLKPTDEALSGLLEGLRNPAFRCRSSSLAVRRRKYQQPRPQVTQPRIAAIRLAAASSGWSALTKARTTAMEPTPVANTSAN